MKKISLIAAVPVFAAVVCGGVLFAQAPTASYPAQTSSQAPVTTTNSQGQTVVYEPAPTVVYTQAPTVVYMNAPVVNISNRHGNLRNAQQNIVQAYQKINRAQADNDGQLGGHAQRAKELLIQADAELRQAANVSNAEGR